MRHSSQEREVIVAYATSAVLAARVVRSNRARRGKAVAGWRHPGESREQGRCARVTPLRVHVECKRPCQPRLPCNQRRKTSARDEKLGSHPRGQPRFRRLHACRSDADADPLPESYALSYPFPHTLADSRADALTKPYP